MVGKHKHVALTVKWKLHIIQMVEEQTSTRYVIVVCGVGETAVHDIGQMVHQRTMRLSTYEELPYAVLK
jgi:5-deoxy-D-glucuronate isomerase